MLARAMDFSDELQQYQAANKRLGAIATAIASTNHFSDEHWVALESLQPGLLSDRYTREQFRLLPSDKQVRIALERSVLAEYFFVGGLIAFVVGWVATKFFGGGSSSGGSASRAERLARLQRSRDRMDAFIENLRKSTDYLRSHNRGEYTPAGIAAMRALWQKYKIPESAMPLPVNYDQMDALLNDEMWLRKYIFFTMAGSIVTPAFLGETARAEKVNTSGQSLNIPNSQDLVGIMHDIATHAADRASHTQRVIDDVAKIVEVARANLTAVTDGSTQLQTISSSPRDLETFYKHTSLDPAKGSLHVNASNIMHAAMRKDDRLLISENYARNYSHLANLMHDMDAIQDSLKKWAESTGTSGMVRHPDAFKQDLQRLGNEIHALKEEGKNNPAVLSLCGKCKALLDRAGEESAAVLSIVTTLSNAFLTFDQTSGSTPEKRKSYGNSVIQHFVNAAYKM